MTEIKTVNLTGTAAIDLTGPTPKKNRRTTKKQQEGGSSESVRGVATVMNVVKGVEAPSNVATNAGSPNTNTWLKYPPQAPVPPGPNALIAPSHTPSTPNASAGPTGQYAVQQGGTKQIKVELKKKSQTKKVQLQPKKAEVPKAQVSKKNHTRKIRKVTLGVSSLHKRMTRAKKLHKTIKDMPLDKLREKMVKGGLIKPNSKAPPSLLRQMASDAEVVAKKAL